MLSRPWHVRRPRRLAALFAATAALLVPTAALANPDKVITGMENLGGPLTYNTLHIVSGGSLVVNPYVMGSATGWVMIKANTITIDAGGSIVADGAGYAGVDNMNGAAAMSTAGGGVGLTPGLPGGGGAYFAAGADGTEEVTAGTCTDQTSSPGGKAFFDMSTLALSLGSAGGAAHPIMATPGTAGGAGGGGIQLSAAVVIINGTLSAKGLTAFPANGVGPGGGSGGSIEIFSAALSGTGSLSVKGGDGAQGNGIAGSEPANNGGGASGGVVLLHLPPTVDGGTVTFDVSGGANGTDCNSSAGKGAQLDAPLDGGCIDVDGDGYPSTQCGGTDCDDSDPSIHPGAEEICNGVDDNCNGQIDEAPNNCTMVGEVCGMVNGVPGCVSPTADGGTDAGTGDGGTAPSYIEVGGGCSVPEGLPAGGGRALVVGLAALAFAASRSRRRRS